MNTEVPSFFQASVLFGSAVLGGGLNAIAGGGSFFSFPALIFTGIPPISANATNNAALLVGTVGSTTGYRKELIGQVREVIPLIIVSVLGGILGSVLLLHTPQKLFIKLVPLLLLLASLIFTFSKQIKKLKLTKNTESKTASYFFKSIIFLIQLIFTTYGGYFGGGAGFLLLATLTFLSNEPRKQLAYKNLMMLVINSAALVPFMLAGVVMWSQAILMAIGALIGGFLSAKFAYKVQPNQLRRFVSATGFTMSVYFMVR
ncbi:MAG: sulfite exporter TauE/SafE family protein [Chroococcidiopsidaceae cyanobacterium CP_BM_ER_R8_30]|nr:sulfite exporter TauE/SafE family protein [Chroococcidiopsidaceae cyanobacterium CP_BM_ER_R8_30]